ncbi:NtaA/DmoA family FMN-dependent monooxygenase [Microbacterium sp. 18062]|uniref:NtaA/DmoA family FMN-dependent monooxygenase n=1 Tax=Microbacterium sp. 18062 TaxID=2681410 RepID=UPI00135CEF29|nr:NtaA/DmoA family FMN-dependent monooxygenase [Microbacterium sp. 18062]
MKELTLGIFQSLTPNGMIGASWRFPENESLDFLDLDYWIRLSKKIDKAGFDFLFLADTYGYPMIDGEVLDAAVRNAFNIPVADPFAIVSAVAAATERLSVVATASTTVERPPALARRLATLDHLTGGRLGWNVVTGVSQIASANLFGESALSSDERYDRAEEYIDICLGLWEGSWEDDALLEDRENGIYADPAKLRQVSYEGKHFSSRGILNVPPSPQRTPLIVQAGTSGRGKDFAARNAEVVFIGGGSPAQMAANIADVRDRAVSFGRERDSIKFLIGSMFVVGKTEQEAQEKRQAQLAFATTEQAAVTYAYVTGLDLTTMDPDLPLGGSSGEVKTVEAEGKSSVNRYAGKSAPAPAVKDILEDLRVNGLNGSVFVGDPASIADQVEEFIAQTDADGFLIQSHITPSTYDDFIDLLLPVFRERGMFSTDPSGPTLRERIFGAGPGLPENHRGTDFSWSRVPR